MASVGEAGGTLELTVRDVMTSDVYAVAEDTSIATAARLLATRHITGAPVVTSDGRPIGVISLADLVDPDRSRTARDGYPLYYRLGAGERIELSDGVAVEPGRVADIMSPFVLSIHASSTLKDAAKVMLNDGVHRLLVVDAGSLVGIVTSTDLLRGFSSL